MLDLNVRCSFTSCWTPLIRLRNLPGIFCICNNKLYARAFHGHNQLGDNQLSCKLFQLLIHEERRIQTLSSGDVLPPWPVIWVGEWAIGIWTQVSAFLRHLVTLRHMHKAYTSRICNFIRKNYREKKKHTTCCCAAQDEAFLRYFKLFVPSHSGLPLVTYRLCDSRNSYLGQNSSLFL